MDRREAKIALSLVLALSASVAGETVHPEMWEVGLKIGGTSFNVASSSLADNRSGSSVAISGIITYPFHRRDWFVLQSEQNVSMKGWQGAQVDHESSYYNISLSGKLMLGEFVPGNRLNPVVSIGPYFAMSGGSDDATAPRDWGFTPSVGLEIGRQTKLLLTFHSYIGLRSVDFNGHDLKYRSHSVMIGFLL